MPGMPFGLRPVLARKGKEKLLVCIFFNGKDGVLNAVRRSMKKEGVRLMVQEKEKGDNSGVIKKVKGACEGEEKH